MIINIRGTSGSGKSTLVKSVIDKYSHHEHQYEEGRKRPLFTYHSDGPEEPAQLVTIGHYEVACGGSDTIPEMDKIFAIVAREARQGCHVLFEGLLISADAKRALELHREFGDQFLVIGLNTPLDLCIESVQQRRRAKKGDDAKPLNPLNTESKFKGTASSLRRLAAEGTRVLHLSREEALVEVLRCLER